MPISARVLALWRLRRSQHLYSAKTISRLSVRSLRIHPRADLAGDDAEAVVLDFADHISPEGGVSAFVGRQGGDEAGW
jgi:hypothetical protein